MRTITGLVGTVLSVAACICFGQVKTGPPESSTTTSVGTTNVSEALDFSRDYDLRWTRQTLAEDYLRHGNRDPKWDAAATNALQLSVRVLCIAPDLEGDEKLRIARSCKEALAAGCNDAMVLYAAAGNAERINRSFNEVRRLYERTAKAFESSQYHPLHKGLTWLTTADYRWPDNNKPSADTRKEVQRLCDLAFDALISVLRDPAVPPRDVAILCNAQIDRYAQLNQGDRTPGFQKVLAEVEKARPGDALVHHIKGHFLVDYAWDARGSDWARNVSPDAWKRFEERLTEAEIELTRAWTLDPKNPMAATKMITVELGRGTGREREVMELWFRRAMDADPNNYEACIAKLTYLEPKWHGNRDEMLSFGRECLEQGNWISQIPFTLVEAHVKLSKAAKVEKKFMYFELPGVWDDIQSVYEPYLAKFPKDDWKRSRYARFACQAGAWDVAHREFEFLGDRVQEGVFFNRADMENMKQEAAKRQMQTYQPKFPKQSETQD